MILRDSSASVPVWSVILRQVSSAKGDPAPLTTIFGRNLSDDKDAGQAREEERSADAYRSIGILSLDQRSLSIPPIRPG